MIGIGIFSLILLVAWFFSGRIKIEADEEIYYSEAKKRIINKIIDESKDSIHE